MISVFSSMIRYRVRSFSVVSVTKSMTITLVTDPSRCCSCHRFLSSSSSSSLMSSLAAVTTTRRHSSATTTAQAKKNDRVITTIDATTGIAHVILNRPSKLNALDLDMFYALRDAGRSLLLTKQNSLRVVIVQGNGRAFCSGLDVPSFIKNGRPITSFREMMTHYPTPQQLSTEDGAALTSSSSSDNDVEQHQESPPPTVADAISAVSATCNLVQEVGYIWRQLPVPVIGAIHGMCFGGGLQIALGCDIRLSTHKCQYSIMESKWGLIPDMTASITLRELLRMDHAKELTFTGRILRGPEAAQIGLVTRCIETTPGSGDSDTGGGKDTEADGRAVQAAALQLAQELCQKSPDALRYSKQLYQSTWKSSTTETQCLQMESNLQQQLLLSWNQIIASGRNFVPWKIPYLAQKDTSPILPDNK